MALAFLPYGMLDDSHEMGKGSKLCYVATRGVVTPSVERQLSFRTLGSADQWDGLVLAMSSRHF